MNLITNIPPFTNDNIIVKDTFIIETHISIDNIEDYLNNILEEHNELCKYYINFEESTWTVSFNIGYDQIEILMKDTFEIYLYKKEDNNSILLISNKIKNRSEWDNLYSDLLNKFK